VSDSEAAITSTSRFQLRLCGVLSGVFVSVAVITSTPTLEASSSSSRSAAVLAACSLITASAYCRGGIGESHHLGSLDWPREWEGGVLARGVSWGLVVGGELQRRQRGTGEGAD